LNHIFISPKLLARPWRDQEAVWKRTTPRWWGFVITLPTQSNIDSRSPNYSKQTSKTPQVESRGMLETGFSNIEMWICLPSR
jgi:hypothetical protein